MRGIDAETYQRRIAGAVNRFQQQHLLNIVVSAHQRVLKRQIAADWGNPRGKRGLEYWERRGTGGGNQGLVSEGHPGGGGQEQQRGEGEGKLVGLRRPGGVHRWWRRLIALRGLWPRYRFRRRRLRPPPHSVDVLRIGQFQTVVTVLQVDGAERVAGCDDRLQVRRARPWFCPAEVEGRLLEDSDYC